MACQAEAGTGGSLTGAGLRQAGAIAGQIGVVLGPGNRPEAMWTSPSPAAQNTAQTILAGLGELPLETAEELAGLSGPELESLLRRDPRDDALLIGLTDLQERAWGFLQPMVNYETDAAIAVVVDALVVVTLVCQVLAMPIADYHRMRVDPGSISVINFGPRRTLLASLNEICHLEGLPAV
jgi:broad specificity phosphatase PhoE